MKELARSARVDKEYRVFLVGGGSALIGGWRESTIDADLYSDDEDIFRDVQELKERLQVNIEFARPENFVPPLEGSRQRHLFIRKMGRVSYYHYDPYSQALSKIVRGFTRDLADAEAFITSGMVDAGRLRALVNAIPDSAWAKYPALSSRAVRSAVDDFLSGRK